MKNINIYILTAVVSLVMVVATAFLMTAADEPVRQAGYYLPMIFGAVGTWAASKAGLIALAKSVAQEMGSRGIRANAIAPGFIETAMTAALSEEVRNEWTKKIPLRRGGKPEDIADVATFLASDLSSYVSGQVIQVDGGMNM